MDVNDCFKERLLIRIPPNREKVKSSIKIAESKLEEAKKLLDAGFLSNAILSAYTCMFHAARALLYGDGFQEKSHFAVFVYLNEKYSDKIPRSLINSFNNYRNERHDILYGFENYSGKEDAENAVITSEDFLFKIKEILGDS